MPLGSAARVRRGPDGPPPAAQQQTRFGRKLTDAERSAVRANLEALMRQRPRPPPAQDPKARAAAALESRAHDVVRMDAFHKLAQWRQQRRAHRGVFGLRSRSPFGRGAAASVTMSPQNGVSASPLRERMVSPPRRQIPQQHQSSLSPSLAARRGQNDSRSPHRVRGFTDPPFNRGAPVSPKGASYHELGAMQRHTIRCHITADLLSRLVRRQYPALAGTPKDVEQVEVLVLKCFGSGEKLARLSNLAPLKSIHSLTASGHLFAKIDGMAAVAATLRRLDLSSNRIVRLEGLHMLDRLEFLDISNNEIERIPSGALPRSLMDLNMSGNSLCQLDDLESLRPLKHIREVGFCSNPFSAHPHYRSLVLYASLSVQIVDGVDVTAEERKAAIHLWDRKSLKPLESELQQKSSEVNRLRALVEDLAREADQRAGQLDAANGLLELSRVESEELRAERTRTVAALRERDSCLSATQVELLQTKSDLEFLRLEVETLHPAAAPQIIAHTTGTLSNAGKVRAGAVAAAPAAAPADAAVSSPSSAAAAAGVPAHGCLSPPMQQQPPVWEPASAQRAAVSVSPMSTAPLSVARRPPVSPTGPVREQHPVLPPEYLAAEAAQMTALTAALERKVQPEVSDPGSEAPDHARDGATTASVSEATSRFEPEAEKSTARRLELDAGSDVEVQKAALALEEAKIRAARRKLKQQRSRRHSSSSSSSGRGRQAKGHSRRHRSTGGGIASAVEITRQYECRLRDKEAEVSALQTALAEMRRGRGRDEEWVAILSQQQQQQRNASPPPQEVSAIRNELEQLKRTVYHDGGGAMQDKHRDHQMRSELEQLKQTVYRDPARTQRAERDAELQVLREELAEARREAAAAAKAPARDASRISQRDEYAEALRPDTPPAAAIRRVETLDHSVASTRAGAHAAQRPASSRTSAAQVGRSASAASGAVRQKPVSAGTLRMLSAGSGAQPAQRMRPSASQRTAVAAKSQDKVALPTTDRRQQRSSGRRTPPQISPRPSRAGTGRAAHSIVEEFAATSPPPLSPPPRTASITPATATTGVRSPEHHKRSFHKYLRKALHCAAIAGEYAKKGERENQKGSVEFVAAELESEIPDFSQRLQEAQDSFVSVAKGKMNLYQQRARFCFQKQADCQRTADRYIARARALLPLVGELDQDSLRSLQALNELRGA